MEALGCLRFAGFAGLVQALTLGHLVQKTVTGESAHSFRWRLAGIGHGCLEGSHAETVDGIGLLFRRCRDRCEGDQQGECNASDHDA